MMASSSSLAPAEGLPMLRCVLDATVQACAIQIRRRYYELPTQNREMISLSRIDRP
jgi:hypothetical protein